MRAACPARRRYGRRTATFHHHLVRRPKRRRPVLCCAQPAGIHVTDRALTGSFDPVWTAQAEGRFIGSAMRSTNRQPLFVVARILVLLAVLSWSLAPLSSLVRVLGGAAAGRGRADGDVLVVAGAVGLAVMVLAARLAGSRRR